MSIKETLDFIDELIRAGKTMQARAELEKRTQRRPERAETLRIAQLARRAGLLKLAMNLLNPYVRPSHRKIEKASDEERLEYAIVLQRMGALSESEALLNRLDPVRNPEQLLCRAWILFARWDYVASLPLLKQYVHESDMGAYQKRVGQVNLAAALVYEGVVDEAEPLLRELEEITRPAEFALLRGTVLQLRAQCALAESKLHRALQILNQAHDQLRDTDSLEALFVRKWRAVANLRLSPHNPEAFAALYTLRAEAAHRRHWETLRDCDFHVACARADAELFRKLYFGTPFAAYRERLEREARKWGCEIEHEKDFVWHLGDEGPSLGSEPVWMRARTGENSLGSSFFKARTHLGALFALVCSDFYRPQTLVSIFSQLFPRRYFSPLSSANNTQRLVTRLRHWLESEGLPLTLECRNGAYELVARAPIELHVESPSKEKVDPKLLRFVEELKRFDCSQNMSSQHIAEGLNISERSARRYLAEARKLGLTEELVSPRKRAA
jgi:hypothetical protein